MKIAVVGAGAAGYFTALNIAEKNPKAKVTIYEKSDKVLSKVRISGGGRCNVTNGREKPSELVNFYPRGQKKLFPVFQQFSTDHMRNWLSERGVAVHEEADNRVFPETNSSQTIIDCFVNEGYRLGIKLEKQTTIKHLIQRENSWILETDKGEIASDKVAFTTGSSAAAFKVLTDLGLKKSELVPSLFTFNINDERLIDLPGISFQNAKIKVAKTKLEAEGPLLITHWGLSGPAVLKLSAYGAEALNEMGYSFDVLINFTDGLTQQVALNLLQEFKQNHGKRQVFNYPQFGIVKRYWERIASLSGIGESQCFANLSNKQINKLTEELTQGRFSVSGKSTFKEEFVTCGGIELNEVDLTTFECKRFPGLYLAGEVLNIDGLTGGFNFQACWSGGWLISESLKA